MKTENEIKNISSIIVQHLQEKKDHKDDLEGITLSIYEKKIRSITDEITSAVNDLLQQGLIIESNNHSGQKIYKLSKDNAAISNFLRIDIK
jgi:hypothetical protein